MAKMAVIADRGEGGVGAKYGEGAWVSFNTFSFKVLTYGVGAEWWWVWAW